MPRFIQSMALALLLLLPAGTLTSALAEERPFYSEGSGFQNVSSSGTHAGIAQATHCGRSAVSLTVLDDPFNPENLVIDSLELRAANGDYVRGTIEIEFFDAPTGLFVGTLTFTGGSGRFENASGQSDALLLFDLNFNEFEFVADGSIDY